MTRAPLGLLSLALAAMLALAGCRAQQAWPTPSPALWAVTGPTGERGWLFGTIHALPAGAPWRTSKLDAALAQAGTLVVEVADLADTGAGTRAFAAAAHSPGLPPLLQRVPPAQRPALAAALERAGLAERDFSQTETWAAALTIANALEAGEAANGVDRALLRGGLPVVALEGFAEQFAIFDRLAPQDQADLLRLAAADGAAEQDKRMTAAWIAGDTGALAHEADAGVLADPELREALLVARNRAWAERVAALLRGGRRPLVAVGAAHMIGEVGLPALLIQRGFTVMRIQ
ncbi:MAG: TraB/GumN family protein [Croceibacterium sp.]